MYKPKMVNQENSDILGRLEVQQEKIELSGGMTEKRWNGSEDKQDGNTFGKW